MSDRPQPEQGGTPQMKAILVVCGALAFAAAPLMTQPFSGFEPDRFPFPVDNPPIQPAGYAFSIWGLIYVWLIASAGFGLVRRDTDPGWDATRWPIFASTVIGASWIGVAQVSPLWATVLIWVMLATALWALFAAGQSDRWWLRAPVGLYAGWLSAASFVSLGTLAMGYIEGLDAATGSWLALIGALVLAAAVQTRLSMPTYGIAVIWALIGIVAANAASAPVFAGAALGGAVALGWLTWRRGRATG